MIRDDEPHDHSEVLYQNQIQRLRRNIWMIEKDETAKQNERERIVFAHIEGIQNQLAVLEEAKYRLEQELFQVESDIMVGKGKMLVLRRSLMVPSDNGEQLPLTEDVE